MQLVTLLLQTPQLYACNAGVCHSASSCAVTGTIGRNDTLGQVQR
jgi:hypothetical protein